jgi:hypothetical protein
MCHLIPCKESIDAIETADLFLRNIVKHHGIPFDIVSDRGPFLIVIQISLGAFKFFKFRIKCEFLNNIGVVRGIHQS